MCRDLGGCGSSSCSGICGGSAGSVPYQIQQDITGFAVPPNGGGFLFSDGPSTYPYFSPNVPFALFLKNVTITPDAGIALTINTPSTANYGIVVNKNSTGPCKILMSTNSGNIDFGLESDGTAKIESSSSLVLSALGGPLRFQGIDKGILVTDAQGNVSSQTTIDDTITFQPTTGSIDIKPSAAESFGLKLTKTTSTDNYFNVTNTAGSARIGVRSDGWTHISSSNRLFINNTSLANEGILVETQGTQVATLYNKPDAINDQYIRFVNAGGSDVKLGNRATGNAFLATNGSVELVGANAAARVKVPNWTEGLVTSDSSGNLNATSTITNPTIFAPTTGSLEVQASAGSLNGLKLTKTTSTDNYFNVTNTAGSARIGVRSDGWTHISSSNRLFINNTSVANEGILVETQGTQVATLYNKPDAINDQYIRFVNAGGSDVKLGNRATGNAFLATNGSVELVGANAAARVKVPGWGTGVVVSNASGELSSSTTNLLPPLLQTFNTVGTNIPFGPIACSYHKFTIVAGGGGGGGKNGAFSGAGGGGGGAIVIYAKGGIAYQLEVGTGGFGGPGGGSASSGVQGSQSKLFATGKDGYAAAYGGFGGGPSSGTAGTSGSGGFALYDDGTSGPNPWNTITYGAFITKGGDGEFGLSGQAIGRNGGGSLLTPASGSSQNGGGGGAPTESPGRGGAGGGGANDSGGVAGVGCIIVETFY